MTEMGARTPPTAEEFYAGPIRMYKRIAARDARADAGEFGPEAQRLFRAQHNAWYVVGIGILGAGIIAFGLAAILR